METEPAHPRRPALGWLCRPGADGASAPRRAHLAPASRVEPARVTWLDSTSCWWSGVPVGGRRTKPEASTAAEEPAHGVQAPAEDVLAKRPNWQAGRLVWEGGRHGPARGLRQFGGVDLALLTFVLPLERLDGHVPGVLLRTGRVRTVRVAVLASHTSRIGTRALNLHERRGRRPAGGDSVDLPPQHRRDSVASAAGVRLGSGAPSHRAVQASSRSAPGDEQRSRCRAGRAQAWGLRRVGRFTVPDWGQPVIHHAHLHTCQPTHSLTISTRSRTASASPATSRSRTPRSTRCSRRAWTPPATSDGSGSSPPRSPPGRRASIDPSPAPVDRGGPRAPPTNLRRVRTWLSRGRTARPPCDSASRLSPAWSGPAAPSSKAERWPPTGATRRSWARGGLTQ